MHEAIQKDLQHFCDRACDSFIMEYSQLKAKSVQAKCSSAVSLIQPTVLLTPTVVINSQPRELETLVSHPKAGN